ncbi:FHA domain containing protein [Gloeothece citriformis PCC 7424]|uniref:FHA domain containing protein n=1 Tax=Gloeothece citriformis (strain PCC 7424) TaxID=65393 RepID=B7KJB2_GLOC7|nr:FHA domain-containing protein [Gloeothece citriformis]ACK72196.1 FHA domain containing protein [Gloeothece citriformis PCC 7424]
MSLIICPECGHENQEDARYCDMCGIELPLPSTAESFSPPEETPESEDLFDEEEFAPSSIIDEELSLEQDPELEPEPEPEIFETPVSETEEMTPPEQEEEMEISEQQDYQPTEETSETVSPVSSATVLDWDEPDLSAEPSTSLEVIHAALIHQETGTRFEFPSGEKLLYFGKTNEEMPVQIDLSSLPDADIISRVHGVIHVEEDTFYLEDAGSLNGTALNGEPVKPGARFRKQLNSGDIITLGRNRKINLTFDIQE